MQIILYNARKSVLSIRTDSHRCLFFQIMGIIFLFFCQYTQTTIYEMTRATGFLYPRLERRFQGVKILSLFSR